MKVTPELEITRKLSELLNSRETIWRNNAEFVGRDSFCRLEGFSERVLTQIQNLSATMTLEPHESKLVKEIEAAVAALTHRPLQQASNHLGA
jgi:hypothetical protein